MVCLSGASDYLTVTCAYKTIVSGHAMCSIFDLLLNNKPLHRQPEGTYFHLIHTKGRLNWGICTSLTAREG